MITALVALKKTANEHHDKNTIKALVKRGLVDTNGNLTAIGSVKAVEYMPLHEQCDAISIICKSLTWTGETNIRPEVFAFNYFKQQGYEGIYCEGGGFGTAIKALCLDALTEASVFFGSFINAREDACLKGVVSLAHIEPSKLEAVIGQIKHTTKEKYLAAFMEINSCFLVRESYPGLTLEFAEALYDAVPKADFVKLARWISINPSHRNGWPDLTLIKEGQLMLVEVKTTDKLHHSQLVTIPALIKEIKADVSVLKLIKNG